MEKAEAGRINKFESEFHKGKSKLNNRQIEILLEAGLSLKKIAERAGISRQQMSNKYNSDFREKYGGVSPMQRKAGLVWVKRRRALESFRERRPLVKELLQEIKDNGFLAERMPVAGIEPGFKKNEIIVNKRLCLVSYATSCRSFYGLRHYSWVSVAKKRVRKFSFWIIVQKIKHRRARFFIFPSRHILRLIKTGKDAMLYVPVELGKSRQRINFFRYLGAWYLLK